MPDAGLDRNGAATDAAATAAEGRTDATGTCGSIDLDDSERTRCEVWTRVMGYHRPVTSWNPGKQSEHRDRRYFSEPGRPLSP